jgi:membrane-associated phospholipid phosphatase
VSKAADAIFFQITGMILMATMLEVSAVRWRQASPYQTAFHTGMTGVVCLCFAALALWVDVPLARLIKTQAIRGDLVKIIQFSEVFAHGSGVMLVIMAAGAIDSRGWRIVPRLLVSAYVAGMLANLLKLLVVRLRPEEFDLSLSVLESFQGWAPWHANAYEIGRAVQSFPSGHTATAMGLGLAFCRLYPRATWFFLLLATLAGMQRMEASAHFLSDVLTGAALGFFVTAWLDLPAYGQWLKKLEG